MWTSSGTSNVEGLEDWKTHLHPPCNPILVQGDAVHGISPI